jgi:hypothetical protein
MNAPTRRKVVRTMKPLKGRTPHLWHAKGNIATCTNCDAVLRAEFYMKHRARFGACLSVRMMLKVGEDEWRVYDAVQDRCMYSGDGSVER